MELRARITIPNVPVEAEHLWERLIERLERDTSHLGPVLSWDGRPAVIVMGNDAASYRDAAAAYFNAVTDALAAEGIDTFPTAVEIEPADDVAAVDHY